MVLDVFWTCLGGLLGRCLRLFWGLESEIRSGLAFEAVGGRLGPVLEASWRCPGGVLGRRGGVLEAS